MDALDIINKIIVKKEFTKHCNEILLWLDDEKIGNYFLDKLPKEFEDLKEIDFLLERLIKARNPFFALNLLENSISEKNNEYIFEFIKKHLKILLKREDDIFGNHTTDIVNKILEKYPTESNRSFDFVRMYINVHPSEFSDLRVMREHGKQVISEIIFRIFKIWQEEKRSEDMDKLVKLIGSNFNLIDDSHELAMFTPEKVFLVLFEYIILDFKLNFSKVVDIIVSQFSNKRIGYGKEFNGKEWSGSGISQSGKKFSMSDRHLVEKVLAPAIRHFYASSGDNDKEKSWEVVRDLCYVKIREISPKKPDFLNRALIPVVLERYMKMTGREKHEAFQILKYFLNMTTVPDKSHVIFQEVLRLDMRDADKWTLVEASLNTKWNKKKLPANVFVEQIVSGLAEKGEKKESAKNLLDSWLKNDDYLTRQGFGEYNVLGIISKLLSSEDKSEGIKIFEEYIYSDAFKNELERFDSFDIADKMANILDFDTEKGIEILRKVCNQDELKENEQILICSGINRVSKPEIRIRVYDEFLKQILNDLGSNIERIIAKFSFDYPRTAIVEFGDKLAKEKRFSEALEIAKIFINDPDPRIDDKDNSLHERLKKGEEERAITSTRGWVCWLLHQFSILAGREYIPQVVPLIERLAKDPNYYVRAQACFPLAGFMRVRNSIMPEDDSEWFISRTIAKKIEKIAFNMLDNKDNQNVKGIMTNLAYAFDNMRSMDTKTALKTLTIFKENKFSEPIKKITGLYVFYAEFRKDAFKGEIWKDLGKFNAKPIKKLLEDFLRNGSTDARQNFLWQFMSLINESDKNPNFKYNDAFEIAFYYIKIIAEKYEPEVYTHIFRFIKENLEKKYEIEVEFFIECLRKEEKALVGDKIDKTWLPLYYHRDVLEEIHKRGDKEAFLEAVDILSNYSSQYSRWEELSAVMRHLTEYSSKNKRVGNIFSRLIEANPAYYDMKVEWEHK
jgi:hypothetical protein